MFIQIWDKFRFSCCYQWSTKFSTLYCKIFKF